jgi:molybdopterin molybdotransferase
MTGTAPRPYPAALEAVLALAAGRATPAETVPLEQALGRALAAPVMAPLALPPWDNAGMDGYAVRRADVGGARVEVPVTLDVIGTSAAGADPQALPTVRPGTAVRIMTGAPLPPGADAVVRVEDTTALTEQGALRVAVRDARDAAGRGNVRPRGEEFGAGAVAAAAGTTVTAAHLGVLASLGAATVTVHRAPRVAVVSGGDELVLLDRFADVLAGRRIVSSSSYALPALLRQAGAQVTVAPLVPDTLDAMVAALEQALATGCDLLVTTGGVSVGAHDHVRDAVAQLGGVQHFWRARIRPGGPIGTGEVGGVPWLGLPGNPVSTLVTATLFARPLLRALGGHGHRALPAVPVVMRDAADTPAPLTYFLRVRVGAGEDGHLEAHLTGAQGSNLLRSMAEANALLLVPEAVVHVAPDSVHTALLLPDGAW